MKSTSNAIFAPLIAKKVKLTTKILFKDYNAYKFDITLFYV